MIGILFCLVMLCAVVPAQTPSPLPPAPPRPEAEAGPTKIGYAVWIGDITEIDSVKPS
jgi:hypothetical protein